jgi:hypothetical protein
MDPPVYDAMKAMRAEKVAAQSAKKAKAEPGNEAPVILPLCKDWKAARELLRGAVTPSQERVFAAMEPCEIVKSSSVAVLKVCILPNLQR